MVGSLCTGYGGLDLAACHWFGQELAWVADNDAAAALVLSERFPGTPNLGDITQVMWGHMPPIDILTAGYPCQPFSRAGNRKGENDERHLWPTIAVAIRHLRPRLIILENVLAHLSLGFTTVQNDLARLGYDTRWCRVCAADAGAPHLRARLFVVATHTPRQRHGARQNTGVVGGVGPKAESRRRHPRPPRAVTIGGGTPTLFDPTPEPEPPTEWREDAELINRWAAIVGRPPPHPLERGDVSRRFVEWMMGLPAGWVTDTPTLVSAQRRLLGNGVVPQQATLALDILTEGATP